MAELQMILEKVGGEAGAPPAFQLWACRGEGRGCQRNRYRARAKHCEDCVLGRDNETLADLQARLARGDA